jgi:hypothetical protein
MSVFRTAAILLLATGVLLGTFVMAPAANADAPKADPEKVKELIEKIRAHRKAKEEQRAKERKEWEERRARGR